MSEEKMGFFVKLKNGLKKTRDNIVNGIDSVFNGFSSIDEDFYEELEEILIMGDIGVNATTAIIERLKQQVKVQHIKEPSQCKQLLVDSIREQMQVRSHGDWRKRCGKDHFRGKACRQTEGAGKKSADCGGGYLPCGGLRPA